ncbi:MAG: hypothetical protein L0Z51_03970 [Candidatus Latescibacteria bacterium]|nr:hypothetical protein [Candidatus Latescibacterota bacterium]
MAVGTGDDGADGSTGDGRPRKRGALEQAARLATQIARRTNLVAEYRESRRSIGGESGKERALHTPSGPIAR